MFYVFQKLIEDAKDEKVESSADKTNPTTSQSEPNTVNQMSGEPSQIQPSIRPVSQVEISKDGRITHPNLDLPPTKLPCHMISADGHIYVATLSKSQVEVEHFELKHLQRCVKFHNKVFLHIYEKNYTCS